VLLAAFEQLAFQHERRPRAGVGDDELSDDGMAGALLFPAPWRPNSGTGQNAYRPAAACDLQRYLASF